MINPEIVNLLRKKESHITLPEIKKEEVDIKNAVSNFGGMLAALEKDNDNRNPVDLEMLLWNLHACLRHHLDVIRNIKSHSSLSP